MSDERILLLDDDKRLLASLERVFRKRFDVDTALRGDVALKKMREEGPYAVVVCDMKMPHMDGIEFVKRARRQSPECVFIMLSGHATLETAVAALNEGLIYKFFNKPTGQDELASAIEEALQEYRLNLAKQDFLALSQRKNDSADIEENVTRSIETATETVQHDAARSLVDVQENSVLEVCPVYLKNGEESKYNLTTFDQDTCTKIRNIRSILGDSSEIVAKVDILMLGKAAAHIFEHINEMGANRFVIDVHFSTLYHRQHLDMYLRICRSLIEAVRNAICFRIVGLTSDILPTRASDLIGRMRPFSHSVFVQLQEVEDSDRFVQGLSNTVLSINCQNLFDPMQKPQHIRRLLNTLVHTSNQVMFVDCTKKQREELLRKVRLDFYTPVKD